MPSRVGNLRRLSEYFNALHDDILRGNVKARKSLFERLDAEQTRLGESDLIGFDRERMNDLNVKDLLNIGSDHYRKEIDLQHPLYSRMFREFDPEVTEDEFNALYGWTQENDEADIKHLTPTLDELINRAGVAIPDRMQVYRGGERWHLADSPTTRPYSFTTDHDMASRFATDAPREVMSVQGAITRKPKKWFPFPTNYDGQRESELLSPSDSVFDQISEDPLKFLRRRFSGGLV